MNRWSVRLAAFFSLQQAVACANAEVKLIAPFLGRFLDWLNNRSGKATRKLNSALAEKSDIR